MEQQMAVKLSPVLNSQIVDENGDIGVGWKINTYVAGSSTPSTTYTTAAGTVAQTNPIITNALGFPTTGAIYLTEGETYKLVLTDENDVVKKTYDNISGVNDTNTTQDQWIASGVTPTYVDANTFTLVGDQTTDFHVGRRAKFTVTAGTVHGYISVSAYTTLTTVDVVLDSGSLDSGLSAVSLGMLTAVDPSLPNSAAARASLGVPGLSGNNTYTGNQTITGDVSVTGDVAITGAMRLTKGADVASTAALPLITDGNYFDVTGNVTITSMASMGVGTWIRLHFDSALTLTHHATDLVLPGEANITIAAGDEADFVEYASGDWRMTNLSRANGQGVNFSVQTITASGTSFDFTVPVWAKEIKLGFYNISTNGTDALRIQLGDSGGIEGTGYLGASSIFSTSAVSSTGFSGGFDLGMMAAAAALQGHLTLINIGNNDWNISGTLARSDAASVGTIGGVKPTSAQLTTVRITTSAASNTFDSGLVTAIYR
jgi:hypothetical protein